MSGVRFSAWLSYEEKAEVSRLARDHGTSDNFIVRLAVRKLLGLSVPGGFDNPQPSPVTPDTVRHTHSL